MTDLIKRCAGIEYFEKHNACSIHVEDCVDVNGQLMPVSRNTKCFWPPDIEEVKEYLGAQESPEISYLQSKWTQEVIDEYLNNLPPEE